MRFICFLFLVAFGGAVALFAMENQQAITLTFFNWSITANVSVILGVTYLLGMLSGWSIIGMLRRSMRRVTEPETTVFGRR